MKFHALILAFILGTPFVRVSSATQRDTSGLDSPDKQYRLVLVPQKEGDDFELRILHGTRELAHYHFEDQLVQAYWCLSRQLVVVDGHDGHAGYYVWVISLADGSVITSHGATRSPRYDRYLDYEYLPDLFAAAHAQMKRLYKGVDDDQMREGYTTVAYGWTPAQQIKVFARFPFDKFFVTRGYVFQVHANLEVTAQQKLRWENVSVTKVKCDRHEPQPAEVTRLDDLLN